MEESFDCFTGSRIRLTSLKWSYFIVLHGGSGQNWLYLHILHFQKKRKKPESSSPVHQSSAPVIVYNHLGLHSVLKQTDIINLHVLIHSFTCTSIYNEQATACTAAKTFT